jgi:hypothetical protein
VAISALMGDDHEGVDPVVGKKRFRGFSTFKAVRVILHHHDRKGAARLL